MVPVITLGGAMASADPVAPRSPLCVEVVGDPGDTAVINVTNTGATGGGYGALRSSDARSVPSRSAADQFSSVNFAPGAVNPNLAFVTIGSDNRICYDSDGATANVLLDQVATFDASVIDTIEPDRLIDTRRSQPVAPRSPLCVEVPGGSPGDTAVVNITNVNATAGGYGALRASDARPVPSRPAADQYSSVNFARGQVNPNLAFVTIGSDGRFCYDSDGGTTDVILDLAATIPGTSIDTIEPERLLDTRGSSRVVARSPRCLAVPAGSPGDTAVLNITNTGVTSPGYGALRASNAFDVSRRPQRQQFSSVNFAPGRTDPNLAFVTIGSDGRVCYDSDGGNAHLILDLVATIPQTTVESFEPFRLIDTRPGSEPPSPFLDLRSQSGPDPIARDDVYVFCFTIQEGSRFHRAYNLFVVGLDPDSNPGDQVQDGEAIGFEDNIEGVRPDGGSLQPANEFGVSRSGYFFDFADPGRIDTITFSLLRLIRQDGSITVLSGTIECDYQRL